MYGYSITILKIFFFQWLANMKNRDKWVVKLFGYDIKIYKNDEFDNAWPNGERRWRNSCDIIHSLLEIQKNSTIPRNDKLIFGRVRTVSRMLPKISHRDPTCDKSTLENVAGSLQYILIALWRTRRGDSVVPTIVAANLSRVNQLLREFPIRDTHTRSLRTTFACLPRRSSPWMSESSRSRREKEW